MTKYPPLVYKIATEPLEFELIHRLNYRTFVEEIPQHAPNSEGLRIDRFHNDNTYVICIRGDELLGMVALCDKRPFSLDLKLDNLDSYIPPNNKPLEIRLLAVDPRYRKGPVFRGLMLRGIEVVKAGGYDICLISGTTRNFKLYEKFGFQAFGPLVGTHGAMFQPMYLTWDAFEMRFGDLIERAERKAEVANFLPGPVHLSKAVTEALARKPFSHRSVVFDELHARVKVCLINLTGARDVSILQGSGTLANDVIGAQLSLLGGRGLVLTNGEFGWRLVDHAERFGLDFGIHQVDWGKTFELEEIERLISEEPIDWLWIVHCETSTGVLNDHAGLSGLSKRYDFKLSMDCVSSVGAVEVDLADTYLASGVSGKALAAPPGLALVFTGNDFSPMKGRLPRYLDLSAYLCGVPFTLSSNLLAALDVALDQVDCERQKNIAVEMARFRAQLAKAGLDVIANDAAIAPHVLTIALPSSVNSSILADELAGLGLLVAYASDYLRRRNWIQVCIMGEFTSNSLDRLAFALGKKIAKRRSPNYP